MKAMEMRKAATQALHACDCEQAIRNAATAWPRPNHHYEMGQVVYFWRHSEGTAKKPANAYWHWPEQVVMTNLPTTVWLAYQGFAVKAAPERIRPAGG